MGHGVLRYIICGLNCVSSTHSWESHGRLTHVSVMFQVLLEGVSGIFRIRLKD